MTTGGAADGGDSDLERKGLVNSCLRCNRLLVSLLILLLGVGVRAGVPEHFFLISVDGLRADLVDRVKSPNLDLLARTGCRAQAARTIRPAVTLPAHASMLSGLTAKHHGFGFNSYKPEKGQLPHPTLLSVAADRGLEVAAFFGKKKLQQLISTETGVHRVHAGYHDKPVMNRVLKYLGKRSPQLMFIHLPDVDAAGHEFGWGTPQQLKAVETADLQIGRLFRAVHRSGLLRTSAFLVLADHGGHGKAHGLNHPKEYQIEWIAGGVGFHPGHLIEAPVSILDTFSTVFAVMGLEVPNGLDGRVVSESLYFGESQLSPGRSHQVGALERALGGSFFGTQGVMLGSRPQAAPELPREPVGEILPNSILAEATPLLFGHRDLEDFGLIPPPGHIREMVEYGAL
jgi:hypothetical protein